SEEAAGSEARPPRLGGGLPAAPLGLSADGGAPGPFDPAPGAPLLGVPLGAPPAIRPSILCSVLCMSLICAATFPTRAWTSCRLSETPWVCVDMVSILAELLAVASCTFFCSAAICVFGGFTESGDACRRGP